MPPTDFSRLAACYEVIEFAGPAKAVHLAVALPKPAGLPDWFPPAALPDTGRLASGRGLTAGAARTSCLGEAAELVSVSVRGNEALVRASWQEVADRAMHPDALTLVSAGQFAGRDRWNAEFGAVDWLPARLDARQPTDWVIARALDGGAPALVPAAHAFIGYAAPGDPAAVAVGDSSGCAAGSTPEAATIAAFLELVERDAAAIWWYGGHRRPALCLADGTEAAALVARIEPRRRSAWMLDLTTDLGIPVCAAISADEEGHAIAIGTAAHFDVGRAALAALTEMLQIEMSLELRRRTPLDERDPFGFWLRRVSTRSVPHLIADGESQIAVTPERPTTLESCVRACRNAGLRFLVVDFTRTEIGIPVARAVVPGLRPRQRRLGPGRLFDVPVSLGWSGSRTAEDMNPIPLCV